MKRSYSMYVLILLVAGVITAFFLQEEQPHSIISLPKVHSYMYSDKTESISISLLTTRPEHYYYDTTYISNCAIKNEEETFSFEISKITKTEINYLYDNITYQQVTFYLKPSLTLSNSILQMEQSMLYLRYDNGEELLINIGEFTYVFDTSYNDDVTLGHLSATYQTIHGISTVTGINLSLTNNTTSNITITNIEIASIDVIANTRYIIEDTICEKHTTVANCLGVMNYNAFTSPQLEPLTKLLRDSQSWNFYIPLSFPRIDHIERFAMIVSYQSNGQNKQLILDDFPFLHTISFQEGYEDEYNVYHIDSNN